MMIGQLIQLLTYPYTLTLCSPIITQYNSIIFVIQVFKFLYVLGGYRHICFFFCEQHHHNNRDRRTDQMFEKIWFV